MRRVFLGLASSLEPSLGPRLPHRLGLALPLGLSRARGLALALGLSFGLGLCGGCARVEPAGDGGAAALMRNLLRADVVEIVVQPGSAEDACWKAAERIASERNVECRVVAPSLRGDPRAVRVVVGGPSCGLAVSLLAKLAIEVGEMGGSPSFSLHNWVYPAADDALVAVFEDPDRPGLPLTILYGNDETRLARAAACLEPGWKPWIRVYRALEVLQEAPLTTTGTVLEHKFVDAAAARAAAQEGYVRTHPRFDGPWLVSAPSIDQESRRDVLDAVRRARRAVERWTGETSALESATLVLHVRPERLAACTGTSKLSSWNPVRREVHALVAPGLGHDAGTSVARLLAEELLGPPAEAWLADAAAVHAANGWWGRDLEPWIAWLRAGDLAPSAAALVDPCAAEANSPHAIQPMRAGLFRFLLDGRGEAYLRALWSGRSALAVDPELERSFAAWLDDTLARHRTDVDERRARRRPGLFRSEYFGGVGIEEPDGTAARGFGSEAFERSLADAGAIGARAAALTCSVALERDPPRVPDLVRARDLGPFEGDLRVFSGLRQAGAKGLRTLLQPVLVTAPGGSLAGMGPQFGEAGWAKFYDGYARALVHCALLAELADADGLSLGGGLAATVSATSDGGRGADEAVAWRRTGWSNVVRAARGAFSGTVTWSADSLTEARELAFWSDLDAVGCDLQSEIDARGAWTTDPLGQLRRMIDEDIESLEEIARRHGKPLILTRIGYRSGAPRLGSPRRAGNPSDAGLQSAEFDVAAAAVRAARERGVLQGAFVWRWSSDPLDGGVNGRDPLLRPGPARAAAARVVSQ